MPALRCAMAQITCVASELEENLRRVERAAGQAAEAGARFVCFPETIDLGWVNPEAHRLAAPVPGPVTERVGALAARHRIWIGLGLNEKDGDRLYDTAVLVDPSGRVVLTHRKINLLAWLMDPPYSPGDATGIAVAETPLGRVGLLICADSFREDLLTRLALLKPDLVCIPYGWAKERDGWPGHGFELIQTVQKAARTIGAPVIGPNLVGEIAHGDWKGRTFEGLSTAADASGLSLVQGRWNKDDLIVFDIEGRSG